MLANQQYSALKVTPFQIGLARENFFNILANATKYANTSAQMIAAVNTSAYGSYTINITGNAATVTAANTSTQMVNAVNNSGGATGLTINITGNAATVTNANTSAQMLAAVNQSGTYVFTATNVVNANTTAQMQAAVNNSGSYNLTGNLYLGTAVTSIIFSDGTSIKKTATCMELYWNSTNYIGVGTSC